MIIWIYVSNLAIALWNVARAVIFVYHPNGDGWAHSVAYCVDCLGNAITGGDPRETISSRSAKARLEGKEWGCAMCAFLGWAATLIAGKPTDHCAESIEPNEGSRAIIKD
ncbi:hypothetical protein B0G76_2831 [Paraburkholderia sp. BL23I1N1]|uniref:hypothetical protein n=1 Tax=Paraburkholderia sp. BL23I1N1 TaxID=1938802 RepID=UPI000FF63F2A|nr:hypothetical protein [Paraburkholderia sp. BL23I1N1]RKE36629.1 hypothetical protein B0G76_2831 [Paraburkholderia sp. BL23I1N1]